MPRYFDRRILLFVSEDNPDALLDTIKAFHLVHHRQPTEVITLSTKAGAKVVQEKVHMRADGPFFDFIRDHEIGIRFGRPSRRRSADFIDPRLDTGRPGLTLRFARPRMCSNVRRDCRHDSLRSAARHFGERNDNTVEPR